MKQTLCQVHNPALTPFRMNTYQKQGGGGSIHLVNTLPAGTLAIVEGPKNDARLRRRPLQRQGAGNFVLRGQFTTLRRNAVRRRSKPANSPNRGEVMLLYTSLKLP
jgi:hypothetical protein